MHYLLLEIKRQLTLADTLNKGPLGLLKASGKEIVREHSIQVAIEARRLADLFSDDGDKAEAASLLHDISAVIPNDLKIQIAESLSIDILDAERIFPLVIHQKLSQAMAKDLFGITDDSVLSAIGCHTTLKANPSKLDMILFIADKLKWDQKGKPPYEDEVKKGLEKSLELGVFAFLQYQYQNRSQLKVIHPWLVEAYDYFIALGGEYVKY